MNEVFLYYVWLRITDEGSISEKSVWSILWIISDLNWRSHLKVANLITSKTKKEGGGSHVELCPYFWTEQVLKFR